MNFGEELTIESSRGGVSWLIWIQLLVLFLLIFLLYSYNFFSSSSLDLSLPSSSSSSPSSSHFDPFLLKPTITSTTTTTNRSLCNQARESQSIKGEIETNTARRIVKEDSTQRDGSLSKDESHMVHHPCNYFQLAKVAFLKCLGLDPTAESAPCADRKKER